MNANIIPQLENGAPVPSDASFGDFFEARIVADPQVSKSEGNPKLPATMLGRLTGATNSGVPLVDFAANPASEPIPARHVCPLTSADLGREALLIFEDNNPAKPIILGILQSGGILSITAQPEPTKVNLDGEEITLAAGRELILRCGTASVTLTRAGKILISGTYVLNRSSGVNRIKGGTVQIN